MFLYVWKCRKSLFLKIKKYEVWIFYKVQILLQEKSSVYDLKYFAIYSNQDTFPKGHFSVCETWQDAMFDHATIGEKVWRISWIKFRFFKNYNV